MIDRSLLAKILSRTSSSSDAETLTALKKANEVISKAGTTWGEILGVETVQKPRSRPVEPPPPLYRRFPMGVKRPPAFTEYDLANLVRDAFDSVAYNFGRGLRGDRRRKRL